MDTAFRPPHGAGTAVERRNAPHGREPESDSDRVLARRPRMTGLDLARGLAVLGMFGAHAGLGENLSWAPSSWAAVVHGRPAALFAVLAGLSIGLLSGGIRPSTGFELVRARARILVRAAWIFLIGAVLDLFSSDINVILTYYAVLFVLALPFLRWSPGRLLLLSAVVAAAAPPVSLAAAQLAAATGVEAASTTLLFSGNYPASWWSTFVLVGLALSRLDLTAAPTRRLLLLAGTVAAVTGYALGWLSTQLLTNGVPTAGVEDALENPGQWNAAWLSGAQPHSGTSWWLLASAGVAVAVIAVCLLIADALPRLSWPLVAVGSMPLTNYTLQVVAVAALPQTSPGTAWVILSTGAVVFSIGWRAVAGRGPLERLLTWSSQRAAGGADRADPASPSPRVEGDLLPSAPR